LKIIPWLAASVTLRSSGDVDAQLIVTGGTELGVNRGDGGRPLTHPGMIGQTVTPVSTVMMASGRVP
jgi:hypothetical protein